MVAFHLLVSLSLFGGVMPFLLDNGQQNGTGTLTDHSYNNLIQLLVDEKESRHVLENKLDVLSQRLDAIDDLHRKVTIQLDKDRNSRESTLEKFADIEHQLRNLTATRDQFYTQEKANMTNLIENLKYELILTESALDDKDIYLSNNISFLERKLNSLARNAELQIGFAAYNPDKTQPDNNGPLTFLTVNFNSGSLYNTTTGKVTIEVSGLYAFFTTIVREPGVTQSYCAMRRNGSEISKVATVGYGGGTSGYASGTTSFVYHLNIGDTIYLGYCHGVDHMHWSSGFQGFLIAPDTQ